MTDLHSALFGGEAIVLPHGGPLYLQIKRWIERAVERGAVRPGDALPSERDLATRVEVSRVTVRKAVQQLVRDGVLVQRHGSGTFVASLGPRVEQSLSQLTSFSEDMARRGMKVTSVPLDRGLFAPSPDESTVLNLSSGERVARLSRLRLADGVPLAIERAAFPETALADPVAVEGSLYAHLDRSGHRPVRAIQRIRAAALSGEDAALLETDAAAPSLHIERIGYLGSGRVVEFTRSVYRGDKYDFVAELRIGELGAGK
jgi:GntR family transcriptional regulator